MCVHVPPFVRIMHRAKVFHAKRKGESESFRIENINLSAHNFGMLLQHFVCNLRDRNILSQYKHLIIILFQNITTKDLTDVTTLSYILSKCM